MGFFQWSKTPANNATADPTINFSEGMAPSAINDSARALMARAAEWRDDISGTITTSGTSTAYVVASNQVFDSLAHMAGAMIAFVPHTTSGATVTINVDTLGAKPLRSAPSVELPSGTLVQGTPYVATYSNVDGSWYLQGFTASPYIIPIGALLPYTGLAAPNSAFVLPSGQAISRTTYATYFSLVGTLFGIGDGTTTFNVPDLRGRAVFHTDPANGFTNGRITAAGGNFDASVGAAGGGQNQTLTTAQLPVFSQTPTSTFSFSSGTATWAASNSYGPGSVTVSNSPFLNGSLGSGSGVSGGSGAGVLQAIAQVSIPSYTPTGTVNVTGVTGTVSTSAVTFGSGNSHPILSPAMALPYILRII